jgi:hypothetical protein
VRKAFRFFWSDDDGAAIDPISLTVEDLPFEDAFPLGMCVRYLSQGTAAAQIRPLGRCKLRFLADAGAPGVIPTANDVNLDGSNYGLWKTVGRLLVEMETSEKEKLNDIATLIVKPSRLWFWPVRITQAFLFTSLTAEGNIRRDIAPGGVRQRPDESKWRRAAIAGFLAGRYRPLIEIDGNDPSLDVAVRVAMPEVAPRAGEQELYVCAAQDGPPQDGTDSEWDPAGTTSDARDMARADPLHIANGPIPARLVYKGLEDELVDVADDSVRFALDLIIGGAAPFTPLRFTRTWKPVSNRSKHFPKQTVVFKNGAGVELHRQSLPSHGILWIPQAVFDAFPAGTMLSVEGGMRWLPYSDDVWKKKGLLTPIPVTMPPPAAAQHIVLRLPMKDAMFEDKTRDQGNFFTCTYFSMRRTARAWVDNRISGGRLNNGVKRTSKPTLDLLREAFNGIGITEYSVAYNNPSPDASAEEGGNRLLAILKALFPEPAVQHEITGVAAPANAVVYTQGEAAYWLWQTGYEILKNARYVRNFADEDMGRGGPGAVVSLGLAAYHCNLLPPAGAGAAYKDSVVAMMIVGLESGAILQKWSGINDYLILVNRTVQGTIVSGHSPVFHSYIRNSAGAVTALNLIDDSPDIATGYSTHSVNGAAPNRNIGGADLWVAANWTE